VGHTLVLIPYCDYMMVHVLACQVLILAGQLLALAGLPALADHCHCPFDAFDASLTQWSL